MSGKRANTVVRWQTALSDAQELVLGYMGPRDSSLLIFVSDIAKPDIAYQIKFEKALLHRTVVRDFRKRLWQQLMADGGREIGRTATLENSLWAKTMIQARRAAGTEIGDVTHYIFCTRAGLVEVLSEMPPVIEGKNTTAPPPAPVPASEVAEADEISQGQAVADGLLEVDYLIQQMLWHEAQAAIASLGEQYPDDPRVREKIARAEQMIAAAEEKLRDRNEAAEDAVMAEADTASNASEQIEELSADDLVEIDEASGRADVGSGQVIDDASNMPVPQSPATTGNIASKVKQAMRRTLPPDYAERRACVREPLNVEVSYNSASNFYTGFTDDISEGGLFISTYGRFYQGERLVLSLQMPGLNEPLPVPVEVRWVRMLGNESEQGSGIGVRFIDPPKQLTKAIREFATSRDSIFYDEDDA